MPTALVVAPQFVGGGLRDAQTFEKILAAGLRLLQVGAKKVKRRFVGVGACLGDALMLLLGALLPTPGAGG